MKGTTNRTEKKKRDFERSLFFLSCEQRNEADRKKSELLHNAFSIIGCVGSSQRRTGSNDLKTILEGLSDSVCSCWLAWFPVVYGQNIESCKGFIDGCREGKRRPGTRERR